MAKASAITTAQKEYLNSMSPSERARAVESLGVDTATIPEAPMDPDYLDQPTTERRELHPDTRAEKPARPHEPIGEDRQTRGTSNLRRPLDPRALTIPDSERELKPFGYDLFANTPSTFAPATDIPVPTDYIVGPGDIINLQLFGNQNGSYALSVSRDGTIVIPKLGPVHVAGLPYSRVLSTVKGKISRQTLGVNVAMNMGALRSIRVFVLGDVVKPGSYTVSSLSTATNAILASGGIRSIGSLRKIEIKRAGKLLGVLDLYDLLLKGDTSGDRRLEPGDVLFVPPVTDRVAVDGRVMRPALYEIKPGETVKDLVRIAGGLTAEAYAFSASLKRIDAQKQRSVKNVNLGDPSVNETKLQNGDSLTVEAVADLIENSIEIVGAASRPGVYQWTDGSRVSDFIRSKDTDLAVDVDFDYGLIVREKNDRRDISVFQFSVAKMLSNQKGDDDPVLTKRDKIFFFSSTALASASKGLRGSSDRQRDARAYAANEDLNGHGNGSGFANDNGDSARGTMANGTSDGSGYGEFFRERLLPMVVELLQRQSRSGTPPDVVEVAGSIRFPGIYPMPASYKAAQLIAAGGGLTEDAYTLNAEVSRVEVNPTTEAQVTHFSLELKAVLSDTGEQPVLQSRDHLFIRRIPAWTEQRVVELSGEFTFPGKYVIRRGETLGQVIERAGGVTPRSDTRATVFTRVELKEQERDRIRRMHAQLQAKLAATSLGGNADAQTKEGPKVEDQQQTADLLKQLESTQAVGRLVIDLPAILRGNNDRDVQLQNGDKIYLQSKRETVTVIGEVQYPASHVYDSSVDYWEYMERSGGRTAQADAGRIYIIRADGSVGKPARGLMSIFTTGVKPGDTIVVPLDDAYMKPLPMWTAVTQIIYQSAVALAAIGSLVR